MDLLSRSNTSAKELLNAQTHVWNHIFSYLNSMALKCAIQLDIPNAIQKHGKPMTLSELDSSLSLHPNRAPSLSRIMRLLCHCNFFSKHFLSSGEEAFDHTINSQLLLKDHPLTLAPFALLALDTTVIEPSHHFGSWLQNKDESPFHMTHKGQSFWEYAASEPVFNKLFNEAMQSDVQLTSNLLSTHTEFKCLVDARAFPNSTCIVFDQPHVINSLDVYESNIEYIGGDMFESIPHAQVLLLKILERCKDAIPSKDEGGKILIIEMVLQTNNNEITINSSNSQFLLDIEMMTLTVGGKERTQEEWQKLFASAGFTDY